MRGGVLWLTAACLVAVAAQTATPAAQSLDAATLRQVGADLLGKARSAPFGVASEILLTRPDSNIQMAVRVKSGQAEWHRDDADILIGVEGSAEIVTGGELVNGREVAPGEMRGDGIRGGTTKPFRAGDVIRIEPRVPHRVLLAPGTTIRYMAVKTHTSQEPH